MVPLLLIQLSSGAVLITYFRVELSRLMVVKPESRKAVVDQ